MTGGLPAASTFDAARVPTNFAPAVSSRAALRRVDVLGKDAFIHSGEKGTAAMSLSRDVLERQLEEAQRALDERTAVLDKRGVDAKHRRRDPKWRQFYARYKQLRHRLAVVDRIQQQGAGAGQESESK
ncbi:MAG: hypothetical protein D6725_13440 [Planctomycetota bacterium]|nr:MAG: hypothetical protein D6725_13440 [Planctomycetota bacterium]